METPVVCDLYARVSTAEQAEEGYSLEEQEARLRSYAKAQGWTVNACHVDPGYSGAKMDRPGLQAVIEDCKAHRVQRVVTYKLDRLSRRQKDTLHLIEDVFIPNGVSYVSMTESLDTGSAFGMAMIGILSVFAQLERETIRERMQMGRLASIKKGNPMGGSRTPSGYRYICKTADSPGRLEPVEPDASAVRRLFELFLQGNSYVASLHRLYDEFPTLKWGKSNKTNFCQYILRNRTYIGQTLYSGQWYQGNHEPIVDEGVFWAVQKRMEEYKVELESALMKPRTKGNLLTGFCYCSTCGHKYRYDRDRHRRKDGSIWEIMNLRCGLYRKNGGCTQSEAWRADVLEDLIFSQVEALRFEDIQPDDRTEHSEIAELEKALTDLDARQARIVDLYALGTIPLETVQAKASEILADQQRIRSRLETLRSADFSADRAELLDALGRVQGLRSMDMVAQRDVLRVLIRRVTLYPGHHVEIDWNI